MFQSLCNGTFYVRNHEAFAWSYSLFSYIKQYIFVFLGKKNMHQQLVPRPIRLFCQYEPPLKRINILTVSAICKSNSMFNSKCKQCVFVVPPPMGSLQNRRQECVPLDSCWHSKHQSESHWWITPHYVWRTFQHWHIKLRASHPTSIFIENSFWKYLSERKERKKRKRSYFVSIHSMRQDGDSCFGQLR